MRRSLLVVLSVLSILPACDPIPAYEAIGIRLASDDRVVVLYGLCSGERVKRVELWRNEGHTVGDANDTLLWRIVASTGADRDRFVVGTKPRDFVIRTTLSVTLRPRVTYAITVDSNYQNYAVLSFRPSDLRVDRILVTSVGPDPGPVLQTSSEYRQQAYEHC